MEFTFQTKLKFWALEAKTVAPFKPKKTSTAVESKVDTAKMQNIIPTDRSTWPMSGRIVAVVPPQWLQMLTIDN
jgi:hypothetical protein